MPDYRRNRIQGGTYFFTVTLRDRTSDLLVTEIDSLRAAVRWTRLRSPFYIDAWVVLPEHMHCLWTLPPDDSDYSARWRTIKSRFSRTLPTTEPRSLVQRRRDERAIWQRRFWEHTIRDDADYAAHMDYVHFNPVKHRLAPDALAWPFSSFRRCVAAGVYPAAWGGEGDLVSAGERR